MAKHLITGGNGFVGSFIAKRLLAMGEEVVVIDTVADSGIDSRIKFFQGDILNKQNIEKAMEGVDYVHHNAALVPLRKAGDFFRRVNVEGTQNVLDVAKKFGVKHFSHMSSSAVFGNVTEESCPIGENPPHLKPIEIYGQSKYDGEKIIINEIESNSDITCSVIRPRTIIGTERLGIFQILFEWISEGRNIYIIGDGSNKFQFAHIDDLVTVSINSAMQGKSGIYNVGTDSFGTLRECLEHLCKHAGTKSKVKSLPVSLAIGSLWFFDKLRVSPLGPWHYLTYHKPYYFDVEKPKNELGWVPKASNDEMLVESYNWYLEHKHEVSKGSHDNKSTHKSSLKQGILSVLKKIS